MTIKLKALTFGCFSLMWFSCTSRIETKANKQDRLFREHFSEVLQEIQSMLYNDQTIRNVALYGSSDSLLIDSLTRSYATRGVNLDSILFINATLLVSREFRDSVMTVMSAQDKKHNQRMIALIDKYGYPESDRIDSSLNVSPFLLLHHSAIEYKDTILSLLSAELAIGRIDTVSYEMIKWDMNGRQGLPDIKGMEVQKNVDGTTTLKL